MHTHKLTSVSRNIGHFIRNRIPPQLVIQTTNRCNATCPQCGMRRTSDISRFTLSGDTIRRILDGCAERGVQAVSFTGGEPLLLMDQLVDWITYAGRNHIPYIRTGTNGFVFRGSERPDFTDNIKRMAGRLAATPLRNFWISLDSAHPEVHEKMRGLTGVVAGIEKALPFFHEAGIYPSANLGLNRQVGGSQTADLQPDSFSNRDDYLNEFYNRYVDALDRFYCFVKDMGFSTINTCYPMSIDEGEREAGLSAVYAATTTDDIVRFDRDEKAMLYKALLDTIPRHRDQLRIFSPLSSLYMLNRFHGSDSGPITAFGCRGGVDFFFIDARTGDTYPCGYRGNENLGKFWNLNIERIKPEQICHCCDWECFRDPSELCAPLLQGLRSPVRLMHRMAGDRTYARLWLEDMRYYAACDFFDGRRQINERRLKRFRKKSNKPNSSNALTPV